VIATQVLIEQSIEHGMAAMAIKNPSAVSSLATYVTQLIRWNRVYNLTAVRQPQDIVVRHILDSLSILPWVQGPNVLDVGSGAGLPGIPLAIMRPETEFFLLDSNAKRTRFMTQVIAELQLKNVEVLRCRVEDYQPKRLFDTVLSRALSSLVAMLEVAGHLCAGGGCVLAMKGKYPEQELASLPPAYRLVAVHSLTVPGLDAARHLVHVESAAL